MQEDVFKNVPKKRKVDDAAMCYHPYIHPSKNSNRFPTVIVFAIVVSTKTNQKANANTTEQHNRLQLFQKQSEK